MACVAEAATRRGQIATMFGRRVPFVACELDRCAQARHPVLGYGEVSCSVE
jgi:hypothetical protein